MKSEIEVVEKWDDIEKDGKSKFILLSDNWDDFGFKTSYLLYYITKNSIEKEVENYVGRVKIYKVDTKVTKSILNKKFEKLDETFCSLGQGLEYYENLKKFIPNNYIEILEKLNDIAVDEVLEKQFINEVGVKTSLLRFSDAAKALNEAIDVLADRKQKIEFFFEYTYKLPNYNDLINISFDFRRKEGYPYRINVVIGKNGTGKTQLLVNLANSISGTGDEIEKNIETENVFLPSRPLFEKVMVISYSAFDSFKRFQGKRDEFSYMYCGLQTKKGLLTQKELEENYKKSLEILREKDRVDIWERALKEIIEEEHIKILKNEDNGYGSITWSSGQNIIIWTITELIANIENESIILFDEPEIHLHPNAISNLMRVFYKLLEEFNSYAIFSTHSPMVIQEVPSNYIRVLEKKEDIITVRKPNIECFGENISNIVENIFTVENSESNYKESLNRLSSYKTYDEIQELFDNKLSLNASIYLKTLYMEKNNEKIKKN